MCRLGELLSHKLYACDGGMTMDHRPFPAQPEEPRVQPPIVYVSEDAVWEYKYIVRSLASDEMPGEEEMNVFGADGWELAGTLTDASSAHFYFKRLRRA
jgi:hypothetical protein